MMYTPKGRHALVTLLLIASSYGNDRTGQQRRHDPTIPRHLAPPWEYILREIVLKSVAPLSDGNALHARPLHVSLYGGLIAAHANDDTNVVLSRGNVHRLPNDRWMLCQDGCVDCEPCAAQRNPLFKWILRKVKRPPLVASDPPRHDLQLTIMPQANDRFRVADLWPKSYVYETSLGKRAPGPDVPINATARQDSLFDLENNFSAQHHRSGNHGRSAERDSSARGDEIAREEVVGGRVVVVPENASSTEKIARRADSSERKHRFGNTRPRPAEKHVEEESQLTATLILGTDQRGHRHLVHVVPADQPPSIVVHSSSSSPLSTRFTGQVTTLADNVRIPKRQTYQRIFRRILDSLNTHRRSIESFLESSANNANEPERRPPSRTDNTEGFTWGNRDADRNTGTNLRLDDSPLSFFHMENEEGESDGHQQYRRRHNHEDTKWDNHRLDEHRDGNRTKTLRGRSHAIFDWSRERRKVRVKPYFISDDANISRINNTSSILLLRNSVNSSVNSAPRRFGRFGNVFLINSAGQIDFNDTFVVDRANNDSVELNEITKIQGNGRLLFGSDGLKSGDANREHEASRHPFGIIITTELPVIRREHETPNRTTTTLQITTSKDAR